MTKRIVTQIPFPGDSGFHVSTMQEALNEWGVSPKLLVDGSFGAKTTYAVIQVQTNIKSGGSGVPGPKTLAALNIQVNIPENNLPAWYLEALKHKGKKETDSSWAATLGAMWGKFGLPQYKGKLAGSTYAWCALFVGANLVWAGYDVAKGNAAAKSWDSWGQAIDYKVRGIPSGAVVRINSGANCSSWTGNHVTFASGSCSQSDVLKKEATFSGYGGNQGDMVKVSTYSVKDICAVRWPGKKTDGTLVPLPPIVEVSKNCSNGKLNHESTR